MYRNMPLISLLMAAGILQHRVQFHVNSLTCVGPAPAIQNDSKSITPFVGIFVGKIFPDERKRASWGKVVVNNIL